LDVVTFNGPNIVTWAVTLTVPNVPTSRRRRSFRAFALLLALVVGFDRFFRHYRVV
jgi:hypothetical protein